MRVTCDSCLENLSIINLAGWTPHITHFPKTRPMYLRLIDYFSLFVVYFSRDMVTSVAGDGNRWHMGLGATETSICCLAG